MTDFGGCVKYIIAINFPEIIEEHQDGWRIGDTYYSKDRIEKLRQESIGYERTINRLQASKLRKRLEELNKEWAEGARKPTDVITS
jgi:hypothetical protein